MQGNGWLVRSLGVLMCGFTISAGPAHAADKFYWVQYGANGLEARAITEGAVCPKARINGQPTEMAVRSKPGPDYPILVCAMPIGNDATDVRVDDVPLPLPKAQPDRILVIGDTGCRLKGNQVQACNDISQWPFRIGADISAAFKPDLVLHVGDFQYRESACPIDNKGCAGTPFGDIWDVWRADFFVPGQALLTAAPWIFVRGNHEECDRGGKGWARTLDPYSWSLDEGITGCLGPAKPYVVDLGGVKLGVVDVSTADEAKVNEQQVAWYKSVFESVLKEAGNGPVWLTFHRPAWATDGTMGPGLGGDNKTIAAALLGTLKPNVQALITGHQHVFEALSYTQDIPVALISGHGGDDLALKVPKDPVGLTINGMTIKAGIARPGIFGFSLLERVPDGSGNWRFTGFDVQGQKIGSCLMNGRSLECG